MFTSPAVTVLELKYTRRREGVNHHNNVTRLLSDVLGRCETAAAPRSRGGVVAMGEAWREFGAGNPAAPGHVRRWQRYSVGCGRTGGHSTTASGAGRCGGARAVRYWPCREAVRHDARPVGRRGLRGVSGGLAEALVESGDAGGESCDLGGMHGRGQRDLAL